MTKKEITAGIIIVVLTIAIVSAGIILYGNKSVNAGSGTDSLEYWTENSPNAQSIIDFVAAVTDEKSDKFVPPEKRIAVFDVDGTLLGELFPTYFDQ